MESTRKVNVGITDHAQYAVVATGGKQYFMEPGRTVAIEKIVGEPGTKVEFKEVLLRKTAAGDAEVGRPFLKSSVKASIVKQDVGPKVIAFRFKRRKKVRVKRGHRQPRTIIRVEAI